MKGFVEVLLIATETISRDISGILHAQYAIHLANMGEENYSAPVLSDIHSRTHSIVQLMTTFPSEDLDSEVLSVLLRKDSFYSIKAVCRLTGLRVATIHAWEKRYKAIEPRRTPTNHRVYSGDDVAKLKLLVAATGLGHSIGNIAQLSMSELADLVSQLEDDTKTSSPAAPAKTRPSVSVFCRRTLQAARDFNLDRLHDDLWAAQNQFEPLVFILDILVPLFAQMAKHALSGRMSIAQEHALCAIIRANVMTENLRLRMDSNKKAARRGSKRVLLTTFDGDYHEFGIMLAAILCVESHHTVHYMGPSMPAAAIAEAITRTRSDVLILSSPKPCVTELPQHPRDLLTELAPLLPKLCEIWIGGDDASFLVPSNLGRTIIHLRTLHDLQKHLVRLIPQTIQG